jgi:hypothetical protein
VAEKSLLEELFRDCVEQVRKEILKKRLKTELNTRSISPDLEFEVSLTKIATLQPQVKVNEFTDRDKFHILDLFVNNE